MIATQRIEGDCQHRLLFSDFDNFASLVLAAMRADTVRHLLLMAVGAFGKSRFFESVVGAAFTGARCGVSTFRIRHFNYLLLSLFELFQTTPAIIRRFDGTMAIRFIAVFPADRTNTFAIFIAKEVHGKQQDHLLL